MVKVKNYNYYNGCHYFCQMNKWYLLVFVALFTQCKNNSDKTANASNVSETPAYVKDLADQIAKKPDSVGLRFNYITALDSTHNYKLALSQLDSLIINDKGNYALWFKKGQVSEHAGDTLGAIRYYNTATTIYPSVDGLLALANLYAETKSVKTLSTCQQIDDLGLGREYDSYTSFFAGVYFSRIGNKDKALFFFDKSISNNYTFMEAYQEKGYVFYDSKRYDKALEVFKLAAEVKNRFADAYYWQGKCYEALNKKADAITKYQQALDFDNSLVEATSALKRLQ